MMNGTKLKLCKGRSDEANGCKHDWKYFVESGCKDNNAYPYCMKCRLVCRMQIPVDCIPKKDKGMFVDAEDFKSPREKKCPCEE